MSIALAVGAIIYMANGVVPPVEVRARPFGLVVRSGGAGS